MGSTEWLAHIKQAYQDLIASYQSQVALVAMKQVDIASVVQEVQRASQIMATMSGVDQYVVEARAV